MKTHKYKTIGFKTHRTHVKLVFQWLRGSDAEVTLVVLRGEHSDKQLSGIFAIADTRKTAVKVLRELCKRVRPDQAQPFNLIPWGSVLARLPDKEKL